MRVEDLPEGGPQPEDPVAEFLSLLDNLLEDPTLLWAQETLEGIQATVGRSRHVTSGQRQAVANIRSARRPDPRDGMDQPREGRRRRTGGVYRSVKG